MRIPETIKAGLPAYTYFYTVGSVGFWLPLYAEGLGFSYTHITLLATVYFALITPSTVLSSIIVDALGNPSRVLALSMLGNGVATMLMPHTTSVTGLIALRALQGISLAASIPLTIGSLSIMHGVRRGVGISVVLQGLGMASGSLLGGILIDMLGYTGLFYSASILSIASALLSYAWNFEYRGGGVEVLKYLKLIPLPVLIVVAVMAARNFFASGVFSVLTIIFKKLLGLGIGETGIALSINPVMQTVTALTVHERVRGREVHAYALGLALTGIVFLMYLNASGPMMIYAAQALLGTGFGLASVAGNIYIISRSPREIRYTASSLFTFAFNLGWVLGTLFAGPLMDAYSPQAWVKASVIGSIIAGLSALSILPVERRLNK